MSENALKNNIERVFTVRDSDSHIKSWEIKRSIKHQEEEPNLELVIYYKVKEIETVYWHRINVYEDMFQNNFLRLREMIEYLINKTYIEKWLKD